MPTRSETPRKNLPRFIEAVRTEYWLRRPYDDYSGGLRQTNTVRVVACQTLERFSREEQLAVIQDLYTLDSVAFIRDDPREVFEASDSVGSHMFDLACEVVWQTLIRDVEIRIEDEIRMALAET
jgi:hypothetical protein